MTVPVKQGDATVGTVYVHSLIDPMSRRFERYGVIALLVAMAGLIFVLLGAAQSRLADANSRLSRQGAALAEANRDLHAQIEQREQAETRCGRRRRWRRSASSPAASRTTSTICCR